MLYAPQSAVHVLSRARSTQVPVPERSHNKRPCEAAQLGPLDIAPDQHRILSIADDPTLLYSRRLLLETAGYVVDSVESSEAIDDRWLSSFDLVLLCHSVPEIVAARIIEAVWRFAPQTPVLLISRIDHVQGPEGRPILVSPRPASLLGAIARQLPSQQAHARRLHATG